MAGMTKRILKGLGSLGKSMTQPNNMDNGGGLSSIFVPRKVNLKGGRAAVGVITTASLISGGASARSKSKMGEISYGDGMARMTDAFNTGGVEAMKRISHGDYEAFSEMAGDALQDTSLTSKIDDFGANPGMIAALYGMGGN